MINKLNVLVIFYFLSSTNLPGQNKNEIKEKLISVSFEKVIERKAEKRKVLVFTKKRFFYSPFTYLAAGMLFVYQNLFSEQIQADCAYATSCSEFTKLSIQNQGFIIGVLSGFNQWSECFKGAVYEHPPAFRNNENKILNRFEKETK